MKLKSYCLTMLALTSATTAHAQNPAVVVTIENTAPYNGHFLTPVWVGFHDGIFDLWTNGTPASSTPQPGSVSLERLAEDGNTGPLTAEFAELVSNGVDGTIRSNGTIPPIGPSQIVSRLFEVDPAENRYFSYASMIIPSNDAFIANSSPMANMIFDEEGNFVGQPFYLNGAQVNDAGTEVNDELPRNTAFFGQASPDTGVDEGTVTSAHPGFNARGTGGILDASRFGDADFTQDLYNLVRFKFTYLDKESPVLFNANIDAQFESPAPTVSGNPNGRAFFFLDDDGESLVYFAFANGLSGDLTAAHLHLAPLTQSGPVVLPLQTIFGRFVFGKITADAVVGPLANGDALDNLVAEMSAGTAYINLHTAANPAGEIRGQVHLNSLR